MNLEQERQQEIRARFNADFEGVDNITQLFAIQEAATTINNMVTDIFYRIDHPEIYAHVKRDGTGPDDDHSPSDQEEDGKTGSTPGPVDDQTAVDQRGRPKNKYRLMAKDYSLEFGIIVSQLKNLTDMLLGLDQANDVLAPDSCDGLTLAKTISDIAGKIERMGDDIYEPDEVEPAQA